MAHLPLVKQGALPAAIASIATGLILENVVRLGFGNEPRGYDRPIARDMRLGEIRVSPQQLETMALALALMLAVFAALAFTRIGKAMRASADNPELAALKGIRPSASPCWRASSAWGWSASAACCWGSTARSIR